MSSARLLDDAQGVEQRREHDDRRAVLVVVKDRDIELGAQAPLDLEAARRRDVLQVDAAERRGRRLDERHDLIDVLGVEAQRERVDAGELLEQHRLALHHRHRRLRADVAKPEHRGAVGDDRDRVALDRQRPRLGRILVNRHRHTRHPGRVGHREIVAGLDRDFRVDLDLAALVHQERAVRDAVDTDALQLAHRPHDRLGVSGIHARDRHIANDLLGLHPHEIDRAEHRLGVRDRASDPSERTALLGHVQAHREAIGGRGLQPQGR